jgi:dCMP deaminase
MDIAHAVSQRGTCDRKKVGCVLVMDRRIVATGYNGSIPGSPHCDEAGHDLVLSMGDDGVLRPNCVRTIHAEMNAIAQAARHGIAIEGCVAYVNTYPCWPCFRVMASAGVSKVVYDDAYRNDPRVEKEAGRAGIVVMKLEGYTNPLLEGVQMSENLKRAEKQVEIVEWASECWQRRALSAEATVRRLQPSPYDASKEVER